MNYSPTTEEGQLIDACIANNRLAQKKLYEKYCDGMFTVAMRMTGGKYDMAADALQDAFINIFKNLAKFRRESTLGAWIKTIVVRATLKRLKREKFTESIEDTTYNEPLDWGDFLDCEYLEKAIMSLSVGYRTVFTLIEIEGYSHKEVGKMLGIADGTSKSQLYHAKRKLKAILKNQID